MFRNATLSAVLALPAAFLAPAALAMEAAHSATLEAAVMSGLPEGRSETDWMRAAGTARAMKAEDGQHSVEISAEGLVPDGLYTVWWVTPRTIGMDMGPGGGTEVNAFTADADGAATTMIAVPADNTYEMMVLAYHADGMTHGDGPGEMGEVTFEHLMGPWPGPAGAMDGM